MSKFFIPHYGGQLPNVKTTNTMEKLESTYFSKLDLKAKERYKEK